MGKSNNGRARKVKLRPNYYGKKWISVDLPVNERDWSRGGDKSIITDGAGNRGLVEALSDLNRSKAWHWPKRKHYFFSDLHADAEAFVASLVASGGVRKTGGKLKDFRLTNAGRKSNFIIGGDCFDKGPSNLELLRTVRYLKKQGARVRILAGNHDIRLLFGMRVVDRRKDVRNEHFFVRAGQKIIPLLKELWEHHVKHDTGLKGIPRTSTCRQRLFPRKSWFERFPKLKHSDIRPAQLERELSRIGKKMDRFESICQDSGLNLRQVYAAVEKWKSLFLAKDGEFHWFYKNMRLGYCSGSLLFIHAGVDDNVAKILATDGVNQLNRTFRKAIKGDPFDFYYGPLCNTIRTKYREVDHPFTEKGARNVRRAGISAIVHGHRNLYHGQRISLRKSLINFECDTTLDRHTRSLEMDGGRAASVTIIEPKGYILGISSDYPQIKVFHPKSTLSALRASSQPKRKGR